MNRYQKLLVKNVKLQIICYEQCKCVKKESFRWHRCQVRLMNKRDNEDDIESLRYWSIKGRQNLVELGYIKE